MRGFLKNKGWTINFIILYILILGPLLYCGITTADEFLYYNHGLMNNVLEFKIDEIIEKGRNLQIMEAFGCSFPFFFKSLIASRFVNLLLLGGTLLLLGRFLRSLIYDTKFISFYLLCVLFFMPIGFGFTVPDAYSAMILIPFIFLLGALILYIHYLNTDKKRDLFLSLLLFGVSCTGKEFFVTYVLLFPCLYFLVKRQGNLKETVSRAHIKETGLALVHLPLAMLYGILVIYFSKHAEVLYGGNQVEISSAGNILAVLFCFFTTALPGRMLFVSKYTYLFNCYNGIQEVSYWTSALDALSQEGPLALVSHIFSGFKAMGSFLLSYGESFRILLILGLFFVCSYSLCRKSSNKQRIHPLILCVALAYSILPALPNAVAGNYANGIPVYDDFASQPVTFLMYCSFILFASALLWNFFGQLKKSGGIMVAILIVLGIYGTFQQTYSSVYMDRMEQNYRYLAFTEDVMEMEPFQSLKGQTIYAPDLFAVRDSWGFSDFSYEGVLAAKGLNIFLTPHQEIPHQVYLASPQDEIIFLCRNDQNGHTDLLLTREKLTAPYLIKDEAETLVTFEPEIRGYDGEQSCHIYQAVAN